MWCIFVWICQKLLAQLYEILKSVVSYATCVQKSGCLSIFLCMCAYVCACMRECKYERIHLSLALSGSKCILFLTWCFFLHSIDFSLQCSHVFEIDQLFVKENEVIPYEFE